MPAQQIRLAIVNQAGGGGATAIALDPLRWGPGRGFEVRAFPAGNEAEDVRRELEDFRPHVVHFHCWYNTWPYELLAETSGRFPTAFTAHDPHVVNQYGTECWECYRNPWCLGCPALGPIRRWRPNHRMVSRFRRRHWNRRTAARLVSPSKWMLRRFARTELAAWDAVVIPNGVDTAAFYPGPGDRQAWGLPARAPVVLFCGNMYSADDDRKGLPDLLEAFPRVREGCPDAQLVVAGRVHLRDTPPWLRVLGEVPEADMPDLHRCADVFCLPTRGENHPLTVLEALATGRPVVATRVGGIPEQVDDGLTGLLVAASAPGELGSALGEMLGDGDRRAVAGVAARAAAEARFTREACARGHETLYRALAGPGRS